MFNSFGYLYWVWTEILWRYFSLATTFNALSDAKLMYILKARAGRLNVPAWEIVANTKWQGFSLLFQNLLSFSLCGYMLGRERGRIFPYISFGRGYIFLNYKSSNLQKIIMIVEALFVLFPDPILSCLVLILWTHTRVLLCFILSAPFYTFVTQVCVHKIIIV